VSTRRSRPPDPGEIIASRPLSEIKAELFRALAHPGRVRILEILRDGARTVSELIPLIGLEPSHLSHQLAVLRRAHVVTSRREAAHAVYAIADPEIVELLAVARRFLINSLTARQNLLDELRTNDR
jgi:DNA-binding transcriptional ArsR family regulator